MRRRQTLVGLAIALALVGLLVYGVGWQEVLALLSEAKPQYVAGAVLAGGGILLVRGLVLERLLRPVAGAPRGVAFAVPFLAGYFARSVLPWGRSTGAPVMAFLLAANSDAEPEDTLAAISLAEVFAFLASIIIALAGGLLYLDIDLLRTEETASTVVYSLSVGILAGLIVAGTVVGLTRDGYVRRLMTRGARGLDSLLHGRPRVRTPDPVSRRLENFLRTLGTVGAARRTLVVAFALALSSWFINVLPLYFAFLALGIEGGFALALLCAPLASFGGILPLPGGTGGIETVLVSLLVTVGGLSLESATASALLFRLSTYWLHVTVCGAGAWYLSIRGKRTITV
ncbi:lysylphosphatidylglycerol synthase transmembrane domain-containing protein [Natrialbaceae archaeon A-CW2]